MYTNPFISGVRSLPTPEPISKNPLQIRKKISYVKNTELERFEKIETTYDKMHGIKIPINSKIIDTFQLDYTGLYPTFDL